MLFALVVLAATLYLLRRFFRGGQCQSNASLEGKNVIVTGCNSGIGKETVINLCNRGARVLMACRSMERMKAAADDIIKETKGSGSLALYQLDLSDLESVRRCAKEINEKEEKIDILINNAGIMMCPYSKTKDGFELHMATNHFGHFLFTNLLLDKLKASGPARIVTVSSFVHKYCPLDIEDLNWDTQKRNYRPFMAYCQSKYANILFTRELARRLRGTDVTCYCVHPGVIHTELYQYLQANVGALYKIFADPFSRMFMKTPKDGCQTSVNCAVDPMLLGESGKYYADCKESTPCEGAQDDTLALKLWELSAKVVGLAK